MEFEAQRTGIKGTWHVITRAEGEGRRFAIVSMLPHCFGEDEQLCAQVAQHLNERWDPA